ncbi:formate-dependent phosphoribosylglycinamide formyltransferase [Alteromonas sp. CYL-A6]|uniref:formate-dependent phosphoribosylglycinamide formyltransferase n=1 Tax=Alteromonas nitratireducens TaxID=3390813 RepID=UPI0034BAD7E9
MTAIGTPFSASATRVMLLGAGELGKEVAIELKRLGCEVIACDRYANAPAMQVADRAHVFSMLDAQALRQVVEQEQPALIVPEIEAIATAELLALEREGFKVVPSANAAHTTMNREGIRRLASETLGLTTSDYRFADTLDDFTRAIEDVGLPCFVKPIMSSSGKGQSRVTDASQIASAWDYAQQGGRAGRGRVIVEKQVDFDFEITLLTVQHRDGVTFCDAIGHRQEDGDYRESWQPQAMSPLALERAKIIADEVTKALGGWGLFGVELFVKGDEVIFSEVSPRPHDTGLVTLISQSLSEFALHARAILGLPVPSVDSYGPSASSVLLVEGKSTQVTYDALPEALSKPGTDLRLFGKPEVSGRRRMGVALATGSSVEEARDKACFVSNTIRVTCG